MTAGIVDTTVIIHLFRKNKAAQTWIASQSDRFSITPYTWLEVIYGAPGKRGQAECLTIMQQFDFILPEKTDFAWAMQTLLNYRLSHGLSIIDCLIASVVRRTKIPLYTDNVKDFTPFLNSELVIRPYTS